MIKVNLIKELDSYKQKCMNFETVISSLNLRLRDSGTGENVLKSEIEKLSQLIRSYQSE